MLLVLEVIGETPRAGRSAWPWPTRCTRRSTPTPPPTSCGGSCCPPWPAAGDLTPPQTRRRWPVPWPPDGQGGAGDGRARRLAAGGPASRWRDYLGADRRPGAGRGVGRDHGLGRRAAGRGRWLSGAGLSPDQAEDRARLGHRAGGGRARTVRRRSLLQVDANAAYTLADARQLAGLDEFGLLLIEQPLDEDELRATPSSPGAAHPDLPGRVDRLGVGRGRRPSHSSACSDRQHQARPGRWLPGSPADPRHRQGQRRCRVVRGHAGDRGSAARPTSRWPDCPGSSCRATPRPRTATTATT